MKWWPPSVAGLAWGGDYNPEQWPEHVWRSDVELMHRAGINLVTVGVFSWALLERKQGRFDFGWLDRVLALLHDAGVRVDLATATAAPPPWLTQRYPEVLPVRADGVQLWPGSRQSYCPTSPVYRELATALAQRMARHYGEHPALACWHVGDEYGCHVSRCYCDRCGEAFRAWLRAQYDDLDALNEAWGTAFWSQHYSAWKQILPPRVTPSFGNPGQLLDFDRFSSDALLDLYRAERDVLKQITPDLPVTTNFMVMPGFSALDYWAWAREVDFVSNDHYPQAADPQAHIDLAFAADTCRGLAGGKPWLLMEQAPSAVNWQPRNAALAPGEQRRHSYAHIARGAAGTLFFQWRQATAGAERFHSSMVPHAGANTRVFREVCQVGEEYQRIAEIAGSTVAASVAMVFDWQAGWAAEQPATPTVDFSYHRNALAAYRALWHAGITVDIVPPDADMTQYQLVVVPALHMVTDADAQRLRAYVDGGGHTLITWFSGIVDEHARVRLGGYPGAFADLLGVRTEEFFPLLDGQVVRLDDGSTATVWTELLDARRAEIVASYLDGPLPGVPAVTRADHGKGCAWYIACGLDDAGMRRWMRAACERARVRPVVDAPAGIEVVRRRGERAGKSISWLVAINHTGSDVVLPISGVELLSGQRVEARDTNGLTVPAGGVVVVREEV